MSISVEISTYFLDSKVFHVRYVVQWNPSTPDTIGTTVSVLISGVSLFQGLICTHLYVFVAKPSVWI